MNNKKEFTCWISLCPHGRLDRRRRGRRYGTLEHRVEDLWPEDGETSNHDGQNDERLAFRQLGRHVSFFSSQGKRGPLVEREDERNVVERLGLSMMATTADFLFFFTLLPIQKLWHRSTRPITQEHCARLYPADGRSPSARMEAPPHAHGGSYSLDSTRWI